MRRTALILLAIGSCDRDQSFRDQSNGNVWSRDAKVHTERAYVYGLVTNARTGDWVDPGEVDVGDKPTTTRRGFFLVSDVPPGRLLIQIRAPGFAPGTKPVEVPQNGGVFVDLALLPFEATATFDASEGGTVSTEDGTSVTFPPCAEGSGAVTASLASIQVGELYGGKGGELDWCGLNAMPGDFSTEQGDMLETFGAFAVDVRDEEGNPVVGECVGAEVRLSPAGNPPDAVDQWTFDPDAGKWTEAGGGFDCWSDDPAGSGCQADLPNLGWWNCDQPIETTCLRACVVDEKGDAAPGVEVIAQGVNYAGRAMAFTGEDGCACLAVLRAGTVEVGAIGSTGISQSEWFTARDATASCSSGECDQLPETLRGSRPAFQAFLIMDEVRPDQYASPTAQLTGPCGQGDAEDLGKAGAWLRSWVLPEARAQSSDGLGCAGDVFHICSPAWEEGDSGNAFDPPYAYIEGGFPCVQARLEITAITRFQTGRYRYSVAPIGDGPMAGATVFVVLPTGVVREMALPSGAVEDAVWIVGDIECDANVCSWKPVNQVVPADDPTAFAPDGLAPACPDRTIP